METEDMTLIEKAVAQNMETTCCDKCGKNLSNDYEKTVLVGEQQYTIHSMTKVIRMHSRESNGNCVGHNLIEHNLCSECYTKFRIWIKQK